MTHGARAPQETRLFAVPTFWSLARNEFILPCQFPVSSSSPLTTPQFLMVFPSPPVRSRAKGRRITEGKRPLRSEVHFNPKYVYG